MPRLDNRADLDHFSYDVQMVMTLLLQEINVLRQACGLPERTPAQVRQAIRAYWQSHPRPLRQGG